MTLTLKLSETQEAILRRRAAEVGQEPAAFLLAAAGIPTQSNGEPEARDKAETGSAYDLFSGLIGGFASGKTDLSENTGVAFAEGMAEKRRAGHL